MANLNRSTPSFDGWFSPFINRSTCSDRFGISLLPQPAVMSLRRAASVTTSASYRNDASESSPASQNRYETCNLRTETCCLQQTFSGDLSMCALTTLYRCVTLQPTCGRCERGLLRKISKTVHRKVSGLMLKISRLLAPPIHPRVSTVAVPSALRLIIRAGRDGALRSA